jgi:hypothetical protein
MQVAIGFRRKSRSNALVFSILQVGLYDLFQEVQTLFFGHIKF